MEEQGKRSWEGEIIPKKREAHQESEAGRFVKALKLIDDFGEEFKEKEVPDLARRLKEERESLGRLSATYVERQIGKARSLGPEKKEEALTLLKNARPGLEGSTAFAEALEKLDKAILDLGKK
jgi:HEAT repeat protein